MHVHMAWLTRTCLPLVMSSRFMSGAHRDKQRLCGSSCGQVTQSPCWAPFAWTPGM
jgi:hypothetical protein